MEKAKPQNCHKSASSIAIDHLAGAGTKECRASDESKLTGGQFAAWVGTFAP
jgi:hypothetical protein